MGPNNLCCVKRHFLFFAYVPMPLFITRQSVAVQREGASRLAIRYYILIRTLELTLKVKCNGAAVINPIWHLLEFMQLHEVIADL